MDGARPEAPADCRALGLADMPPEIRLQIAEVLERPRDLVAAQMASALFWHVPVERCAARWGAGRLRCLIEAGAPAAVVSAAIAHGQQAPSPDLIQSAVLHGDVRVLDVLCRALEVHSSFSPSHCRHMVGRMFLLVVPSASSHPLFCHTLLTAEYLLPSSRSPSPSSSRFYRRHGH